MPPSSDPSIPTVTPVTISYSELQDKDKDLSVKIEEGFGPNGLGILSITQVPGYSSLCGNLLRLSPRYNFGWIHGKEKLESGKPDTLKGSFYANPILDSPTTDESLIQRYPSYCGSNIWLNSELPELEVVVENAIHVSGLTATYKLHGHNNGLWYWPIGARSVPGHYEGTIAVSERIVNVVNYNCGEIQQQPRFEAQLRSLLTQITSAVGANKSVPVTIDELKKQQQSSDATVFHIF